MFLNRMFLGAVGRRGRSHAALAALRTVACAIAILFVMGDATAAESRYSTPLGTVIVEVDSNWTEMSSLPDALEGIGFEVDNGKVMQFMLGTLEDLPTGSADAGTLRQLTNDLRRSDAEDNLTVSDEVMTLSGPNFRGYYYLATNPASVPAPGDFKHMYTGFIAVGSDPLLFIIAWNAGGKTSADRALATLKRLRIERR
jgi:hypothetical protein